MDSETKMLLDGFERWMLSEAYAPATVRQTRIDAARVIEDCLSDRESPVRLRFAGLRLRRFLDALELGIDLGPRFAWLLGDEAKALHQREQGRGRKLEARSVDDANWLALYQAVMARPGLPARVLETQMVSGLRVGDVLGIERAALETAIRNNVLLLRVKGGRTRELHLQGPLRTAFEGLGAALHASSVQEGLGGTYSAAYKRVMRELHRAAEVMHLPGRAHTHRLRRTVAMQALRTTRDVRLVQQLLGHLSPASTLRYVDEERPGEVADVAGALHDRFLGGSPR